MSINEYTLYEITTKLVGPVQACGEHGVDMERLQNLKILCSFVDKLVVDISKAASTAGDHRASMKSIGDYASEYLTEVLGIPDD